jgi:hypothetical protein
MAMPTIASPTVIAHPSASTEFRRFALKLMLHNLDPTRKTGRFSPAGSPHTLLQPLKTEHFQALRVALKIEIVVSDTLPVGTA